MQVTMTNELQDQMRSEADYAIQSLAAIVKALGREGIEDGELREEIDDQIDLVKDSIDRMLTLSGAVPANKAMLRKIAKGECVDLKNCLREDGYYIVPEFTEGLDYCDTSTEAWIWSIGRRHHDNVILASTASDLYQNPDYECLFLR